jgi:hypothetical protein
MNRIEITTNHRGQTVVRIYTRDGLIHDEAAFASSHDALGWAQHFIVSLEPS